MERQNEAMPESNEHEHSILTEQQHQRVAALNTAAACLGARSSVLTTQRLSPHILPGDLIRVAQWIIDGQLTMVEPEGYSVERDKRSGFMLTYEVKTYPLGQPTTWAPKTAGEDLTVDLSEDEDRPYDFTSVRVGVDNDGLSSSHPLNFYGPDTDEDEDEQPTVERPGVGDTP